MYRPHMKAISYLGKVDSLFGAPVTTRNWKTIMAVVRILKDQEKPANKLDLATAINTERL